MCDIRRWGQSCIVGTKVVIRFNSRILNINLIFWNKSIISW